ncbi:MAG: DEAD/DEAH box helicase [Chloroflexaceae bacterium]|nr:DEAD/DEAH box helicase [Chloroflexaceae bacterium]
MIQALSVEAISHSDYLRGGYSPVDQAGKRLYEEGKVTLEHVDTQRARLQVTEDERTSYRVTVRLTPERRYSQIEVQCSCKSRARWHSCPHGVAALLLLRDHLRQHPPSRWKGVLGPAVHGSSSSGSAPSRDLLVLSLQCSRRWNEETIWEVIPYTIPEEHMAPEERHDPAAIVQAIRRKKLSSQVRQLRQRISPHEYAHLATEVVAAVNLTFGSSSRSNYASESGTSSYLESVFTLMPHCVVYFGTEDDPLQTPLTVLSQAGTVGLAIDGAPDGLRLAPLFRLNDPTLRLNPQDIRIIIRDPIWMLAGPLLLHLDDPSGVGALLIEHPDLLIAPHEQAEFLEDYVLPLASRVPVGGSAVQWEEVNGLPTPRLYLAEEEGELQIHLRFGYGAYEVGYDHDLPPMSIRAKATSVGEGASTGTGSEDEKTPAPCICLARVHRQPQREEEAWNNLPSCGLRAASKKATWMLLRKNLEPLDFLMHQVPKLIEQGYEVYGEKDLSLAPVNRSQPRISFVVSSGIDWFDVQAIVHFGEFEVSLKEIQRAIRKRERYLKLADGTIGAIPDEWIERYRHLFSLGREMKDRIRLSESQMALLDQLLEKGDHVQADEEFERRRQRLHDFSQIVSQKLPDGFVGTLRPYQKAGYDWLHFLHTYGFGGCLADDMGTGKTVQTLAFLQSLYEWGRVTSATLIIVPRSLLFNWEREAATFTPHLRVFIHADQNRIRDPAEFGNYQLILTTYGVMLRDADLLRQYTFAYLILDESQTIKNPVAETSRVARELKSEHRLTLTGTPVENTTLELWSQFAFLNPGMLGKLEYFRKEFVTPIEQKQDQQTAHTLRRMVYPFILRRTKDQVARDLPPRTERILMSDMEPEQRAFYNRQRDYYRGVLLGMIEEEGMERVHMKVLEGLLRLRQICNHPRLVDPEFAGASAKFDLLLETLETLQAEGHKALVFSQFVQMLSLVRETLDARQTPYAYLDGQTRNRQAAVDRFQNDSAIPFFLISLKAGGVGLNLTAADYVIHVDPWWNPAVEMQATDRTHRIGQDQPVFVYKLVMQDSVEEKVLQLQAHKRAVVEQVITAEGSFFKELSTEDVTALFT